MSKIVTKYFVRSAYPVIGINGLRMTKKQKFEPSGLDLWPLAA